jgi:hypothetical protein
MSGALGMLLASSAGTGSSGYIARYTGTLTSGNFGNTYGYVPSTLGTLSPTTFTYLGATLTITSVVDVIAPSAQSYIAISGWSSDPGAAAIYSFQWKSNPEVVFAGTYNYTTGTPNVATWTFSTGSTTLGLAAGIGTSGTMVLKG